MTGKPELRQLMRSRRRQLPAGRQLQAAIALATRLQRQPIYRQARRIAAYIPNDGEIDPTPLLFSAQRQGKQLYLPVLRDRAMIFVRYRPGLTPLQRNGYGIPEPRLLAAATIDSRQLDLVLLPLVAFDNSGRRLGMGGGYYDRTFAWKLRQRRNGSPHLVGLAHHLQQYPAIPDQHWDVPLAMVATDKSIISTAHNRNRQAGRARGKLQGREDWRHQAYARREQGGTGK